jgi:hypothetical protein
MRKPGRRGAGDKAHTYSGWRARPPHTILPSTGGGGVDQPALVSLFIVHNRRLNVKRGMIEAERSGR